jgi:hypothetical protein
VDNFVDKDGENPVSLCRQACHADLLILVQKIYCFKIKYLELPSTAGKSMFFFAMQHGKM